MYVGRNQLDGATLDRFVILNWEYDEEAEMKWAGGDPYAISWVPYVQKVRKIVFDHKMKVVISPRASITGSALLRSGMDRATVENVTLWNRLSKDDAFHIASNLY